MLFITATNILSDFSLGERREVCGLFYSFLLETVSNRSFKKQNNPEYTSLFPCLVFLPGRPDISPVNGKCEDGREFRDEVV